MKVLEQNSNRLVYKRQANFITIALFIYWGLSNVVFPFIRMFYISTSLGVEVLTCKRVEPTQVNCKLTRSTYMGWKKEQSVLLNHVKGARVKTKTDSEGNKSYNVVLLSQQSEVVLFNTNRDNASRINIFVRDTNTTPLIVKQDNRWNALIIVFVLCVVLNCVVMIWSFYEAIPSYTYTFDKTLNKFIRQRKIGLINQVEEYPLQGMEVKIQERVASDENKLYRVSLLLNKSKRLILIPFFSVGKSPSSNGELEKKVVKNISLFLDSAKVK